MCQKDYNKKIKEKKYQHLNYVEKTEIERWYNTDKRSCSEIAKLLNKSVRTIQREIKRGLVENLKTNLEVIYVYSADVSEQKYRYNMTAKGPNIKLDTNYKLVDYIENGIKIEKKEIAADGFDDVEFLISTNPGEEKKPLGQVASGGELSRVMLGIKTVLADKDAIETLIFDEIDTGISGKTAWKVSEKMGILGRGHQLICITHLPQIAAMADQHFCIEKKVEDKRSVTDIRKLAEEESVTELARMLGSDSITENVMNNAREMKDLARKTKQY